MWTISLLYPKDTHPGSRSVLSLEHALGNKREWQWFHQVALETCDLPSAQTGDYSFPIFTHSYIPSNTVTHKFPQAHTMLFLTPCYTSARKAWSPLLTDWVRASFKTQSRHHLEEGAASSLSLVPPLSSCVDSTTYSPHHILVASFCLSPSLDCCTIHLQIPAQPSAQHNKHLFNWSMQSRQLLCTCARAHTLSHTYTRLFKKQPHYFDFCGVRRLGLPSEFCYSLGPQFPCVRPGWFSFLLWDLEVLSITSFQFSHVEKNALLTICNRTGNERRGLTSGYMLSLCDLLTTWVCIFQLKPHEAVVKALGELDILLQWMEKAR